MTTPSHARLLLEHWGIGVADWIDQFADLLNVAGNKPGKQLSATALQIIAAIREQLEAPARATSRLSAPGR